MTLVQTHSPKKAGRIARGVVASVAALGFGAVLVAAPLSTQDAVAEVVPLARGEVMNQELMAAATEEAALELPAIEVQEVKKEEPAKDPEADKKDAPEGDAKKGDAGAELTKAPPSGTPDPGSAKAIAQGYVGSGAEYDCLVSLWERESNWNVYAHNASSGAYGIPQSLPGSKMASAGPDWQTNADTQIRWGLGYIKGRYGSPCAAWGHSNAVGWY